MRYSSKRSYSWDSNIAYTVGLMASDGCLSGDGRHLDLTSVDIEQLNNFSIAIGRPLPISKKKSGEGRFGCRVQFSDVAYYDFLLNAGLTPAKSKTLGELSVPRQYYADFLRGLFDGDGTCYGYMDPRWRSSFMFYMAFASASVPFLEYIKSTNGRLAGTANGTIRPGVRGYSLTYAKTDTYKLTNFIYYRDDLLALSRKKLKLQEFIRTDQSVIMSR